MKPFNQLEVYNTIHDNNIESLISATKK